MLKLKSQKLLDKRLATIADLADEAGAPKFAKAARGLVGIKPAKKWANELRATLPDVDDDTPPAIRFLADWASTFEVDPTALPNNAWRKREPHLEDRLFQYQNGARVALHGKAARNGRQPKPKTTLERYLDGELDVDALTGLKVAELRAIASNVDGVEVDVKKAKKADLVAALA